MKNKEQIINNLREYSAADIVKLIKCGDISLYELSKSGKLTPLMRKRIEEQLAIQDESIETKAAEETKKENVDSVSVDDSVDQIIPPAVNVKGTEVVAHPANEAVSEDNSGDELIDNHGMFKRPFSFKGRIRRTEFWVSYIFYMIWYALFSAGVGTIEHTGPAVAVILLISMIPACWFLWAQGAKRCHDRGHSGWFQIIPFYGLVMLFGGSDEGINDYGTSPKE